MYVVQTPVDVVKRLLLLSWVFLLVCLLLALGKHRGDRPAAASLKIDPNSAPWWELTVLPDVGPVLAREIVEHRRLKRIERESEGRKVYESLADLDEVKGIGPKRLSRMQSFLAFDLEIMSGVSDTPQSVDHDRDAD